MRSRALSEIAIVCALCVLSSIWAARYWTAWTTQGNQPQFYQAYFEPAVMIACGHGFVTTAPTPPAVTEFLQQRRDSLSCADIPAGTSFSGKVFQRAWFYLMWFVGLSWKVLGISWSGLGPAFGLLFAASTALVYGLCRLVMARPTSLVVTLGVSTSPLRLNYMPHLRDFAKEPFVLALFFILGLLVIGPLRPRRVIALAVAYGLVIGVAYGFRTDFLVDVPLFLIVVFLFLEGGPFRRLTVKLAAVAAFAAGFAVTGWPVISSVQREGGCQWHAAILGLQSQFNVMLGVQPAPYDFGYAYADTYAYEQVTSFAARTQPPHPRILYCTPEYDVQSGRYMRTLVTTFPADFVTRAYASGRLVAESPFIWWQPPLRSWLEGFFVSRGEWLKPLRGIGIWLVAAAALIASARNIRLGVFLLVFALYVGGYPAIQFDQRHFFHLEFIVWWSAGFVIERTIVMAISAWRAGTLDWRAVTATSTRMAVVALGVVAVILLPLAALRAYQTARVKRLLSSYAAADKTELSRAEETDRVVLRSRPLTTAESDLIEVEVDAGRCGAQPVLTLKYDHAPPEADFTRAFTVTPASSSGVTRVFLAVFANFDSVQFPASIADCVQGGYRLAEPGKFPLLVDAILPPDWAERPLHQQLARWVP